MRGFVDEADRHKVVERPSITEDISGGARVAAAVKGLRMEIANCQMILDAMDRWPLPGPVARVNRHVIEGRLAFLIGQFRQFKVYDAALAVLEGRA